MCRFLIHCKYYRRYQFVTLDRNWKILREMRNSYLIKNEAMKWHPKTHKPKKQRVAEVSA